jgi:pyruvate/2-oxoglutarate dehydrogenase complex dihydrolipoamide acyltransferase (E2) component
MSGRARYRKVPFTMNRRMVAASAAIGRERSNIHAITEVDISAPRRVMDEHRARTGERLSLTAYLIACLSRAIAENPFLNSFRRGRKLVLLEDVTISVLVERELSGERVPEPFAIQAAQSKSYRQIHNEIRAAQAHPDDGLGGLSGARWVRFIPGFLFRTFIRAASRSIYMQNRYGVVGVTAVGMFADSAVWFIPLSAATVTVTVGGIVKKPVPRPDSSSETRDHLCLTVTFSHDIVDGAPAARFLKRFTELLMGIDLLREVGIGDRASR